MKLRSVQWLVVTSALAILLGIGDLGAQQAASHTNTVSPTTVDYANSRSFPNVFAPYVPRLVPEAPMSNSQRVRSLIHEGKMYLSLDNALALALENNLDIGVARYNIPLAQSDYLRTKSGGAVRGVAGANISSALFAGAIGGSTVAGGGGGGGGGAGGFSGGGGAVQTSFVGCCDPVAGFNVGWDRRTSPLNNIVLTGIPTVASQNTSYTGFFGQGFLTGTSYVLALSGFRQSQTANFLLFNPEVPTGMTIGFNQRLLNGFGYRANAVSIRIAKNDLKVADSVFRQQVITTSTQILNLYWDLVSFRENVGVAEKALALAQKTLSDNKRQVEIGTLAPIEVVRAESEVAARQQDLIVAQTSLQQQQELLKTALSKRVGPELVAAEIIPTDNLPQPTPDDIPPLNEALREAVKNRPEIEQADLNMRNQEFTIQSVRNRLLPSLDIFATYAPTGLSGNRLVRDSRGNVVGLVPGGIWQSFTGLLHGNFPDYSFGGTLQIPIRNRSAQADAATALLQQRQMATQLQQRKNQVEQDVRSANIAVIQARAQIEAARKAVALAQQTLDAEQKKFQLGESTVFLVIQAQRDLATAGGNEVRARSTYAKALTQFAQATGTTLARNHIEMAEAKEGQVARVPNIPGAGQSGDGLQSPTAPPKE